MRRALRLDIRDLWAIQGLIRDNTYFIPPGVEGLKPDATPVGLGLSQKVRDAILRYGDEDLADEDQIEIEFEELELWLIDRHVPNNSYSQASQLLLQVFRALYEDRLGMRVMTSSEVVVVPPPPIATQPDHGKQVRFH